MRRILVVCVLITFALNTFSQDFIYPTSLTITGYDGPIEEGCTLQLQAIPTPSNTTYDVYNWSSSTTSVATVDDNGLVTAVSEGTATITCVLTIANPGYFSVPYEQTATCTITVKKKSSSIITFVDPEVKRICVENWDTDNDGELSHVEAAAVTDIGVVFKGNKTITSFDELQYFRGLTSIMERAFENCTHLSSLIMPEGISSIGRGAFLYCAIESLYIPASVVEIGLYAYVGNKKLISIQVDDANTHYDSRNQCNAIIETSTNTLIQGCKTTIIPSGVKNIGNFAFEFMDLAHIDLPQGLEKIAWCAFYGCTNLDEIIFPDGLKFIDRYAFNGCLGLKGIVIPASVEYLGGAAFAGCYNIETLTVAPGSETYISPEGSNAIFSKDGSVLVVGSKNSVIPETVVTIGEESFRDQSLLTNISFPANLSAIKDYAFCGCTNLNEIDIPSSVESIGEYAFSGCHLFSVNIRKNVPIAITADVFTNRDNAVLYVPKGCRDSYIAADYWKDFKEIVEKGDPLLGDVNGNDEIDIGDVVSIMNFLMGREVASFIEKAADTNKNGLVDIGDVVTIINYLMGTIEKID